MRTSFYMKKLDEEDLFSVTGGTGVVDLISQESDGGLTNRQHARSMSAGAAGGSGAHEALTGEPEGEGVPTAMVFCTKCGQMTLHRLFSGGRQICSICSEWNR